MELQTGCTMKTPWRSILGKLKVSMTITGKVIVKFHYEKQQDLARPRQGQRVAYHCQCKKGCLSARACPCVRRGVSCHSKCHHGTHCKNETSPKPCATTKQKKGHQSVSATSAFFEALSNTTTSVSTTTPGLTTTYLSNITFVSTFTTAVCTTTIQSNARTLVQSSQPATSLVLDPRDTQPRTSSSFNTRTQKTTSFVSSITQPNTSPLLKNSGNQVKYLRHCKQQHYHFLKDSSQFHQLFRLVL